MNFVPGWPLTRRRRRRIVLDFFLLLVLAEWRPSTLAGSISVAGHSVSGGQYEAACNLLLTSGHSSMQVQDKQNPNQHQHQQQSNDHMGLAEYCSCRDPPANWQADSASYSLANKQSPHVHHISQLECWPRDLDQFVQDFARFMSNIYDHHHQEESSRIEAQQEQVKIDYLHISSNISQTNSCPRESEQSVYLSGSHNNNNNNEQDEARNISHRAYIDDDESNLNRDQNDDGHDAAPNVDSNDKSISNKISAATIDHLALHLELADCKPEQSSKLNSLQRKRFQVAKLGQQMIDLGHLINENQVKSLSMLVSQTINRVTLIKRNTNTNQHNKLVRDFNYDPTKAHDDEHDDDDASTFVYSNADHDYHKLAQWLSKITNLTRLELNGFDLINARVNLRNKLSKKLKWLNMAKSSGFSLTSSDPIMLRKKKNNNNNNYNKLAESNLSPELEFLSLESCNLSDNFKLVHLLRVRGHNEHGNLGHPKITSLNLASNKIRSIDLLLAGLELNFKSSGSPLSPSPSAGNCQCARIVSAASVENNFFQLPSLTQLDLNSNKVSTISESAGQLLQCIAPQLSQLYLAANSLLILNLNWLLTLPLSHYSSSLEHLDLSHNQIKALTWFNLRSNPNLDQNQRSQLKSINLNYNKLDKRPIIEHIPPELVESFNISDENSLLNLLDIFQLQAPSLHTNRLDANVRSLCDLLKDNRPMLNQLSSDSSDELGHEIMLIGNELVSINEADFNSTRCHQLQVLKLTDNRIESITKNAFRHMIRLEQLHLSQNELETLPVDLFKSTSLLRQIDLSHNKIQSLDADLLSGLHKLEELRLDSNMLKAIPGDLFASQGEYFTLLSLSRNQLDHFDFFRGLTHLDNLQIIRFDHNELESIGAIQIGSSSPPSSHQRIQSTNRLLDGIIDSQKIDSMTSRRERKIGKVSANKSYNQKKLTTDRKDSSIRERFQRSNIESSAEAELLDVISVSGNHLISFSIIQINNCPNFILSKQILLLADNQITSLNESSFRCFENVISLHLERNLISTIHEDTFTGLRQLENLDLSANRIMDISNQLSPGTFGASLKMLNLADNMLKQINLSHIIGSSDHLEVLNLSDNEGLIVELSDLSIGLRFSKHLRQLYMRNILRLWLDPNSSSSIGVPSEQIRFEILDLSHVKRIDELLFGLLSNHLVAIDRLNLNQVDFKAAPEASSKWSNIFSKVKSFLQSRLQYDLMQLNLASNPVAWQAFSSILHESQSSESKITMGNYNNQSRYILSHLNGSNNGLSEWPFKPKAMACVSSLLELDLSRNNIRVLLALSNTTESNLSPASSAMGLEYKLDQLVKLNLNRNSLETLIKLDQEDDSSNAHVMLADYMPELRHLDLSDNALTSIRWQFFEGSLKLENLNLSRNRLTTFLPRTSWISSRHSTNAIVIDMRMNMRPSEPDTKNNFSMYINFTSSNSSLDMMIPNDELRAIIIDGTKCVSRSLFISRYKRQAKLYDLKSTRVVDTISNQFKNYDSNGSSWLEGASHEPFIWNHLDSQSSVLCNNLIPILDFVRLDTWTLSDHVSIEWNPIRLLSLSLETMRHQLELPVIHSNSLVYLSARNNGLINVNATRQCLSSPRLKSLVLSFNSLGSKEIDLSNCAQLNYLDLSHNDIESLRNIRSNQALDVLILRGNKITTLGPLGHNEFSSLKLLDIRDNMLASLALIQLRVSIPRISAKIIMDLRGHASFRYQEAPILYLNSSLIHIKSSKSFKFHIKNSNYNRSLAISETTSKQDSQDHLEFNIRLCSLSQIENFLCVDNEAIEQRCFRFRLPNKTKSCLTNLENLSQVQGNKSIAGKSIVNLAQMSSSQVNSYKATTVTSSTTNEEDFQQQDFVLNSIEYLKATWLRMKNFDLNSWLTQVTSVGADSVFTYKNGKAIHTIDILRFAFLIGAFMIVLLMLILFFLLTRRNSETRNSSRRKSISSSPTTESQSLSATNSTSIATYNSSSASNSKTSNRALSPCSSSNLSNEGSKSNSMKANSSKAKVSQDARFQSRINYSCSSSSSSDKSNHQMPDQIMTKLDTNINQHKMNAHDDDDDDLNILDAGLLIHPPPAPLSCSTPCSSLAPSSIETAETMQAIDSIKSSSTIRANGSVDQYESMKDNHHQANEEQMVNPKPAIATVLRMVKSNSANTFMSNRQAQSSSMTSPMNGYNYSTLRDRVRCQPPTIYEIAPVNSMNNSYEHHYHQYHSEFLKNSKQNIQADESSLLDATTMSLQSLNSSLVASMANTNTIWVRPEQARTCDNTHYQQQAQTNDDQLVAQEIRSVNSLLRPLDQQDSHDSMSQLSFLPNIITARPPETVPRPLDYNGLYIEQPDINIITNEAQNEYHHHRYQ